MLYTLIFIGIVLLLLAVIKNKKIGDSSYKHREPLTEIEQVAFWRLKEAMGEDKVVLAQVAFSSFIRTSGNRKAANSKFYKAKQKVADFVICNKDFSIHAIVEVDDKTHSAEKDKARDAITEEAGIKTFRVEAKALPSVNELRKAIL